MSLYILDSDHLSLYQRGHKTLYPYLSSIPPEQMAITIISVEELLRGRLAQVRRAATPQTRIRAYEWLSETIDFISNFTVLQYKPRQTLILKRSALKKSALAPKIYGLQP
jgi:tRNA(fMet)-specific endonuclease VapC